MRDLFSLMFSFLTCGIYLLYYRWSCFNLDDNFFHFLFSPIQCLLDKISERRTEREMMEIRERLLREEKLKIEMLSKLEYIYYSYDENGYFW